MIFIETFKMALEALSENKMRSLLTSLGIIIGVSSVCIIVSLGKMAEGQLMEEIGGGQADFINFSYRPATDERGKPTNDLMPKLIQDFQKDEIKKIEGVDQYMTRGDSRAKASYFGEEVDASLLLDDPISTKLSATKLLFGRYLDESDGKNINVCLISKKALEELKLPLDSSVLGRIIQIGDQGFEIVGVVDQAFDDPYSSQIFLMPEASPIFSNNQTSPQGHRVLISDLEEINEIGERVRIYLNSALINDPSQGEFFSINTKQVQNQVNQVMGIMTAVIGGIGAIALLVGGIGVMNISLVSVTERTREIGIRRAMGAKKRDISLQFLLESLLLTLIGGLMGIGFAIIFILIISKALDLTFIMPKEAVIISFLFSILVGLVFGIGPARSAAEKNPLEALNYE